jgi:hypothetical protein
MLTVQARASSSFTDWLEHVSPKRGYLSYTGLFGVTFQKAKIVITIWEPRTSHLKNFVDFMIKRVSKSGFDRGRGRLCHSCAHARTTCGSVINKHTACARNNWLPDATGSVSGQQTRRSTSCPQRCISFPSVGNPQFRSKTWRSVHIMYVITEKEHSQPDVDYSEWCR